MAKASRVHPDTLCLAECTEHCQAAPGHFCLSLLWFILLSAKVVPRLLQTAPGPTLCVHHELSGFWEPSGCLLLLSPTGGQREAGQPHTPRLLEHPVQPTGYRGHAIH